MSGMDEQQRHELAVALILAAAGVEHLDIGERVDLDSGYYVQRTESGIWIGGGR